MVHECDCEYKLRPSLYEGFHISLNDKIYALELGYFGMSANSFASCNGTFS
jgi:hypothetical protein